MVQVSKAQPELPLWVVLKRAAKFLDNDPEQAEVYANEVLKFVPAEPHALLVLVSSLRLQLDTPVVRARLETLAEKQPNLAALHYELGSLLAELGERELAVRALSRVVELEPSHPAAWRLLGDQFSAMGDAERATNAYDRQFRLAILDTLMLEHSMALGLDEIESAGTILREFLTIFPTDVTALHMLGQLHMRVSQFEDAEKLFARALALCPDFLPARRDYAGALHHLFKRGEEIRQLDILLEREPDDEAYRYLKATALYRAGRFRESLEFSDRLLQDDPTNAKFWMARAYALRGMGSSDECIAALRNAIKNEPGFGEAWQGLASLKTVRFAPTDVATMRAQLQREDLGEYNRIQLHFALGAALEDRKQYTEAFEQFSCGNALQRAGRPSDADEITRNVQRAIRQYTREFFRSIAGRGCSSTAPIFVLGMPRSGSTLVEQILSSHSSIEGAGELPALGIIAKRTIDKEMGTSTAATDQDPVPLAGEDLSSLGEEYLERTREHRKLGLPFFVDKMPNNFRYLGLICAILPGAKIIDVRRHPLACCLSNFKQLFPSVTGPSQDLADMGRYYRDYVDLMAHFDAVLPGRVHRIFYEDLVRNPNQEIVRLLGYCGLPMEEGCLGFHELQRGVFTLSSEQVRRPIFNDALEHWRNFEPWLDPLKTALGPVLEAFAARESETAGPRA